MKTTNFITILDTMNISYTINGNGFITVDGSLDLSNTNITKLPYGLTVKGLLNIKDTKITKMPNGLNCDYMILDHKNITNIVYRENCGIEKRTIFAINTVKGIKISVSVLFDTLDNFEIAVDKYFAEDAKAYKTAARECVAELTAMRNVLNLGTWDYIGYYKDDLVKREEELTAMLDAMFEKILDTMNIPYTININGDVTVHGNLNLCNTGVLTLPDNLTVNGFLDISITDITKLPTTLNCRSLYLEHKNITNIAYREIGDAEEDTIFAVNTKDGIKISADGYFDTLVNFEITVDKHFAEDAKVYKTAARECVAELTAKRNTK